ncbi:unnamed protein product [Periconia digitata]|uniref:protein geranylgeranyltransferase type II n=1 Tax=Periconia digitata TaxID=1303443 RepID=A0A9W4UVH6_9PLEO|nr:unnamed protein product [Periconia digitata]
MSLVSGPGRAMATMPSEIHLYVEKHVSYIQSLDSRKHELEYWLTEHLRLNGLYWGLTALHLLGHPHALPRAQVLEFVFSCLHGNGGFGAAPGHDPHMLYTVSAVQILATLDAFSDLDAHTNHGCEKVAQYIANLQDADSGTFSGDEWGEKDTRFLYGALNALSLMGFMHLVNVDKAVQHVHSCANFDGAYGTSPGAESHSGQVFTCLGALTIAGRLDLVDQDKLGAWLSERQLKSGGLNGRPEKTEDVCYSWWVMSSLAMLDRLHWIDGEKLSSFILQCQDPDHGGLADSPGNMVDVFHTVFGLAGLSLLKYPSLVEVDPVYRDRWLVVVVAASEPGHPTWLNWVKWHLRELTFCPLCNSFLSFPLHLAIGPVYSCCRLPFLPRHQCCGCRDSAVRRALFHPSPHLLRFQCAPFTSHFSFFRRAAGTALHPHKPTALHCTGLHWVARHCQPRFTAIMAAIPLICTICPKKPNFSDVSHLLTHIASKGHLSNYYKLKVRSSNEDASRRSIEAYDRWYSEWNVEELMSDRMVQKDKRRSRGKPAGAATGRAAPTPQPKIEAPVPRQSRSRASGNLLDPRLYEQQMMIKVENSTPVSTPRALLRHRPFVPYMQYWASESRASSRTGSYTNPDYDTSSEYSDPSERRRYQYPADNSCAIEDDNADTPLPVPVPDPMAVSESTKLKGVYWPGMDIFDSATPEMRRKRNQKKDSSVVEQLELNSQEVEATELIFTPQGSFKRQRRISSSDLDDEDDIPVKTESPKSLPPRAPLADLDVNTLSRGQQLPRSQFSYSFHNGYETEHRGLGSSYTHAEQAQKRKRSFDVFQEEEEEVSFTQPATFNYLTAALHQQASPTLAPMLPNHKAYGNSFHADNKENTLPMPHQSNYEHIYPCAAPSYHYHAYSYGLDQDLNTFSYHNPVYNYNAYQQQSIQEDDQRTITAPPSPSTT